MSLEILPSEVQKRLADPGADRPIRLLDCREPWENATASIAGSTLIPMNSIPQNLQQVEDLAEDATVVVYCHHGMRSLMVVNWLREHGVPDCLSMSGGIDRWSIEIDRTVPRY